MTTGTTNQQWLGWQLSSTSPHHKQSLTSSAAFETKISLELKDELLELTLVLADNLVSAGVLGSWELGLLTNWQITLWFFPRKKNQCKENRIAKKVVFIFFFLLLCILLHICSLSQSRFVRILLLEPHTKEDILKSDQLRKCNHTNWTGRVI